MDLDPDPFKINVDKEILATGGLVSTYGELTVVDMGYRRLTSAWGCVVTSDDNELLDTVSMIGTQ